jgi:crotonobetainyl-CoA:carnitine CoA-transferase CaiB-like acyl-CoA transferase
MFTQAIMDYSLNGRVQEAISNRDVHGRHPAGVYPAKSPGTALDQGDHWVAIAIEHDEQWRAFARALGNPEWAADPRFETNDGRAEHFREIDRHIAAHTAGVDDYELMNHLQAHGVPCAPVLEASRMFEDPHLRARNFFQTQTVEGAGTHEYVGPMWKFGETPIEFLQPPVTFGEHNDYVYRDVLALSESEYQRLKDGGHVAVEYDPSVP